jgi:TatD DNase family protein
MPEFKKDLEEVLERARASGVHAIFTVGTEQKDWGRALEIANSHPWIYAILGVHPHNANEIDDSTYPTLKKICQEEKVRAFGEIGLDFFRNHSPRDVQMKRFREQIGLAKELKLPIVVHDRDAHEETLEVLRSEGADDCGGIIHCFSGDLEMARKCMDMGFCISIPGSITYKNAESFQKIVRELPFRGKRNEPGYVRYTAQKVAEIKKIPFEKVAEATTENALRIFRLKG